MDAKSMDRESTGCQIVGFYCTLFFLVDVWRQVTGYGVKYINDDTYPIPQTAIVALTETFKFIVFFGLLTREGGIRKIKGSFLYVIPSLIYAVNNNVYYYALHYTTPPIWNIIIQLRIVFTALIYRVVFKRVLSIPKCVGIVLLLSAIILTNTSAEEDSHGEHEQNSANLLVAFTLAGFGSITSAIGAIVMEYLFKNDKQSFSAMQCQLYFYASIASWFFYGLEASTVTATITGDPASIYATIVACIILSSASGVVVAMIVKKLDNIVKLYAQAVANTLTSIACALLFPDDFQFSLHFFFCLMLMIVAVFTYESETIRLPNVLTFKRRLPKLKTLSV